MKLCINCNKEIADYINYCSWQCNVDLAKKSGGKIVCPNDLPIVCIKHDNTMLEHEHADHPDYKFSIHAEYCGEKEINILDKENGLDKETHALIYHDEHMALAIYECCYAMWSLTNGDIIGGAYWRRGEWRLAKEDLQKIRESK